MTFATPSQVLAVLERAEEQAYVRPKTKTEKLACYRAQALGFVQSGRSVPNGAFHITPAGLTHLWIEGKQ